MPFTIRPATIDDLPQIQDLNHQLFIHEKQFGDTYNEQWMYQEKGQEYFIKRLNNEDGQSLVFVALQHSEIVGYLCGYNGRYSYRLVNPIAEIENMYVLPDYRNQGIGTQLVVKFKARAKLLKAQQLRVSAYASNHQTISFYQKLGFSPHEITLEQTCI